MTQQNRPNEPSRVNPNGETEGGIPAANARAGAHSSRTSDAHTHENTPASTPAAPAAPAGEDAATSMNPQDNANLQDTEAGEAASTSMNPQDNANLQDTEAGEDAATSMNPQDNANLQSNATPQDTEAGEDAATSMNPQDNANLQSNANLQDTEAGEDASTSMNPQDNASTQSNASGNASMREIPASEEMLEDEAAMVEVSGNAAGRPMEMPPRSDSSADWSNGSHDWGGTSHDKGGSCADGGSSCQDCGGSSANWGNGGGDGRQGSGNAGKSDHAALNRRMTRNTMILYVRMAVTMLVSFITVRLLLQALGADDYGISVAVLAVVTMANIVASGVNGAVGRFITVNVGRGDSSRVRTTVGTGLTLLSAMVVLVVLLGETAGQWFLGSHMTIPAERMTAARCILHSGIISYCLGIIGTPFGAMIGAHERFGVYAGLSITDAFLRLAMALTIAHSSSPDRLILYAWLMVAWHGITFLLKIAYSLSHFPACRTMPSLDKPLAGKILRYAVWSVVGNAAATLRDYGGDMLVNVYTAPVVNAARGVAGQAVSLVTALSVHMSNAVNPQITKSYARGEQDYCIDLTMRTSRYAFYLVLLLSIPALVETRFLLSLWLDKVPAYAVSFTRLFILFPLLNSLSCHIGVVIGATGRIRNYQLVIGGLVLLNVPISWICLSQGLPPECVPATSALIAALCLGARLYMLHRETGTPVRPFVTQVYLHAAIVGGIALAVAVALHYALPSTSWRGPVVACITVMTTAAIVWWRGCSRSERQGLLSAIKHPKATH